MTTELSSRERVLRFFRKEKIDRIPCFSGMGNVILDGLDPLGWRFAELHQDAYKMAMAAATTYRLTGYECAVVPYDYTIEGEALGSTVNFYPERREQRVLYPIILDHEPPAADTVKDIDLEAIKKVKASGAGRIPLVVDAIRLLKKEIGDEVAVAGYILGPYGIAGQITSVVNLSKAVLKDTDLVHKLLKVLTDFIADEVKVFREAGADYVTIREMTSATELLSPATYEKLILPHLQDLFSQVDHPKIMHSCGDTDANMVCMKKAGADFISVEQKNHIVESRKVLAGTDIRLMGNIDVYKVLTTATPEEIDAVVKTAIEEGVNAVWPACDIWPEAPKENLIAMVAATKKYGKLG